MMEKRCYKYRNPVSNVGVDIEFHKLEKGYYVYETEYRGRGVADRYAPDFYLIGELPDYLNYAWEKGTPF